jgi:hypothetical protein
MIELHITFDERTGNVNVNGPLHNKGLCYLMLECTRDVIKDYIDEACKVGENQPVTPPTNKQPPFIPGRSKRRR